MKLIRFKWKNLIQRAACLKEPSWEESWVSKSDVTAENRNYPLVQLQPGLTICISACCVREVKKCKPGRDFKRWPNLISSSKTGFDKCWFIMSMKSFAGRNPCRQGCCCLGWQAKSMGWIWAVLRFVQVPSNEFLLLIASKLSRQACLSECPSWPSLRWIAWYFWIVIYEYSSHCEKQSPLLKILRVK